MNRHMLEIWSDSSCRKRYPSYYGYLKNRSSFNCFCTFRMKKKKTYFRVSLLLFISVVVVAFHSPPPSSHMRRSDQWLRICDALLNKHQYFGSTECWQYIPFSISNNMLTVLMYNNNTPHTHMYLHIHHLADRSFMKTLCGESKSSDIVIGFYPPA